VVASVIASIASPAHAAVFSFSFSTVSNVGSSDRIPGTVTGFIALPQTNGTSPAYEIAITSYPDALIGIPYKSFSVFKTIPFTIYQNSFTVLNDTLIDANFFAVSQDWNIGFLLNGNYEGNYFNALSGQQNQVMNSNGFTGATYSKITFRPVQLHSNGETYSNSFQQPADVNATSVPEPSGTIPTLFVSILALGFLKKTRKHIVSKISINNVV
ncbi:hypothetical protein, partial [Anabaena sp. UHCC 0204]